MKYRPLARALLGLVIGFGAASFVIYAVERGATHVPIETVGTPNINDHCRTHGETFSAMLQATDAYGWRCVGLVNRMWDERSVDISQICVEQFGPDAYSRLIDPADPVGWRCVIQK